MSKRVTKISQVEFNQTTKIIAAIERDLTRSMKSVWLTNEEKTTAQKTKDGRAPLIKPVPLTEAEKVEKQKLLAQLKSDIAGYTAK
jgi:hypothetical protein